MITSNAIVSEVVKHLEMLPPNRQRQVLTFVQKLSAVGSTGTPASDEGESVAEVVARIKAMPPNSAMITQPQGDLADALRNSPTDPDFDLDRWQQAWAAAEAELKRLNRPYRK